MTEQERMAKAEQILNGVYARLNFSRDPPTPKGTIIINFIWNLIQFCAPIGLVLGQAELIEILRAVADMLELAEKEIK